jgi:hypothetical protein
MADGAHGNIRSYELRQVTASAGLVPGKRRRRGIIVSQVTGGAGK